jgi:hypothetical protein
VETGAWPHLLGFLSSRFSCGRGAERWPLPVVQDALAYTKGDKTRWRATAFDAHDLDVGKVSLSEDDFARASA